MDFEIDDLDWAMGELLQLFNHANRLGVYPHELNPKLFRSAWSVISWQPVEISVRCRDILMKTKTGLWSHVDASIAPKRYANPLPH